MTDPVEAREPSAVADFFYYSEIEALAMRQWTGHTAFDDPTAAPDAPPRESIEIRTISFMSVICPPSTFRCWARSPPGE